MTHGKTLVYTPAYTLAILMATNATVAMAATATAKTRPRRPPPKPPQQTRYQTTATKKTTVAKAKLTNQPKNRLIRSVIAWRILPRKRQRRQPPQIQVHMIVPVLTAPTVANVIYPSTNSVIGRHGYFSAKSANIPLPTLTLSNISTIKPFWFHEPRITVQLDVSVFDDFITYATPMASYYPPVFRAVLERTIPLSDPNPDRMDWNLRTKSKCLLWGALLRAKLNTMGL